jgi:hypothetical protein
VSKTFAAPATIRRIAARRVFESGNGKAVVLTLGVPRRLPGSDWGCAVQITGLQSGWRKPRYVFGIDALQALHLAMKCAAAVLDSVKPPLMWLGERGDLGMPRFLMPRFLPEWPKPHQDRLEGILERETTKMWRRSQAAAAKTSRTRND